MRVSRGRVRLLAATALAGLPGLASAQLPQGIYVSAGIGANIPQEARVEPRGAARAQLGNQSGDIRLNVAPMGTIALGYGFGNGVRVELEGSLRSNEVDSARGFPTLQPLSQARGTLWQVGAMANAYYDVSLGEASWIQPYLGVGLGYVYSDWRNARVAGQGGQQLTIDSGDGNFAYQAIVGAAFPIAAVPGLSATAEYRFMGQLDPSFDARLTNTVTGQVSTGKVEVNPYQHAVLVGLRYVPGLRQAAPEPAPFAPLTPVPPVAAAPAPAQSRTFVVFFGLGSASLNERARQLVAEAAQTARSGGTTRIEVTGHTDSAGSAAANQRLSVRRAEAVASELQRRGVSRGDITIRGMGDTQPVVATGPNAREPQNRRVEIVVR